MLFVIDEEIYKHSQCSIVYQQTIGLLARCALHFQANLNYHVFLHNVMESLLRYDINTHTKYV